MRNHPNRSIAGMIQAYAAALIADCGDDAPTALLVAATQAQTAEEAKHIGRALLCRNEALADAPYRYGGASYDHALQAIADRLGWSA